MIAIAVAALQCGFQSSLQMEYNSTLIPLQSIDLIYINTGVA